jgi:flagellar hook-associated protein 3 FlgL
MTSITTSTSAFYERSIMGMAALRADAEALQNQLGTGNKLLRSSDDPVSASRIRVLQRADSLSKIDTTNATRATSDLNLTDTALASFADTITRIKELSTQAANGTLTPEQRAGIGTEVKQLYGNLVGLANSRDSSGHSLFGGETAGAAYALDASGNATYIGTDHSNELSLGDGQSVTRSLTGPEFLDFSVNGNPTNLLAVVKSLGEALQGGASDPQSAATDALTALDAGLAKVTTAQTVVGSRLSWIDLTTSRSTNLGELRSNEEQDIGATDIASTVAKLQQTMLVLEASQASFTKLSSLSLFNSLR